LKFSRLFWQNFLRVLSTERTVHDRSVERQKSLLSAREVSVLRLLAWGHTNKEIAQLLEISVKTVEAHKSNGMRKLNLPARWALVRYALASGWLSSEAVPPGAPALVPPKPEGRQTAISRLNCVPAVASVKVRCS
jgi:DNA-binding CsgD family transcriptional regulator